MYDNLHISEVNFTPLTEVKIVTLTGPDAAAFCHAQFASDVATLSLGHWQWSTWLTPKGRVIAIFLLAHVDEQQVMLVLPDGDADAIAAQLRRFVFRRKVRIEARDDLTAAGHMNPPPVGGSLIGVEAERRLFDLGAAGVARTLGVLPTTTKPMIAPAFAHLWRQFDLRMGLPRLDASQREQWTPQQIGLDRLNAYSVKKGCYPGQEIVARTHFLGKAKRSTRLLELVTAAQPGDAVQQGEQIIGRVVSVASGLALAVLPLESELDGLTVAGAPVRLSTLLDGLAR